MVIERDLYNQIKPYFTSKQAIVITGMRRVGKTTLLQFIYDRIDSPNKLMIDLENPLNRRIFEEIDYERIKSSLEGLGLQFQKKAYLFLDEIQFVKNIPSMVKYLIDHYNIKFFLTGSASFYLKNLFSESLAGRKYIFELFPFNFREFLKLKQVKIKVPPKITRFIWESLNNLYREYMEFGGFPEVIFKKSTQEKQKVLKEIFSSYFQMEVKQISDFRKTDKIRDLILLLMEQVGSKIDIKKLSQELNITRPTIYDYLSFLEGTYFIKLIKPFSKSRDVEIRKAPKVYVCDSGLANNLTNISRGPLFEQNIFQNLRLKGEVNYYQRKTGAEIDFIVNKKKAYEVKISPTGADVNKLSKISKAIDIDFFRIISLNYSALEKIIYGFKI